MAATSAPTRSVLPIVVPGQLTLRTIRGKNGPFTVGRLSTPIGEFAVKDAELEQYPEGKYDGDFVIRYIFAKSYPVAGGARFEVRANLDGMTLNGIDKLSRDEARSFATQDVDPLDEELGTQPAATPATPAKASRHAKPAPVQASADPLVDTTPFGVDAPPPAAAAAPGSTEDGDAALFGLLWPPGESVKLDSTIDRRTLRAQIARLGELGYALDFKTQEWSRQAELQSACSQTPHLRRSSSTRRGSPLRGGLRLNYSRRPLMGWYFSPQSRSELIAELIAPQETERASVKVIAHALRGNVLWSVAEVTAKVEGVHRELAPGQSLRYIRCDLLERSGGQWGCKPLDESMHPYYYSCPLSYLDLAPEQSADWRAGVRAYHARRRTPTASTAPAAAPMA